MSLLMISFLLLLVLLAVAAAIILLTDPSRVDAEEKEAVERERAWLWRH
jgi:hypothetical protein